MNNIIYKTLYQEAHRFLMQHGDKPFIEKQFKSPVYATPKSLKEVYKRLLESMVSTKGMKDSIGPVEGLAQLMFDFNPKKIQSQYSEWEIMYEDLNTHLTPSHNNGHKHIRLFCQDALSGASFLCRLGSVKTFKAFIGRFQNNEMAMAVLPLLLQKIMNGLGFQIACAFLNHTGYADYVSPDPKVKLMLRDMGVIESIDNYEAFKNLIIISRINQKTIIQTHKMFWLIGSGIVSGDGKDLKYRKQFLDHIIPILNQHL